MFHNKKDLDKIKELEYEVERLKDTIERYKDRIKEIDLENAKFRRKQDQDMEDTTRDHAASIQGLKQTHRLELAQRDFDMKHFKDEQLKKAEEIVVEFKQELAVLRKENDMMEKAVNINSDIVDIKDVLNKIIDKLPTINLTSLGGGTSNGTTKE